MGAPGAGKGTQAKLLAKRAGIPHISTGDILRQAAASGSELGREARRYMDGGQLVPDQVVVDIVEERLRAGDTERGFLLDGFPRTRPQAEALDRMLARNGQSLSAVIELDVPAEALVQRLSGRRTCQACGTMFHTAFTPSKTRDHCDRCGNRLVQREDDREDTIRRRLEVYARETAPVLDHYRAARIVHRVPGTGTVDEVFGRVTESLR
jgi:adenylate kinase